MICYTGIQSSLMNIDSNTPTAVNENDNAAKHKEEKDKENLATKKDRIKPASVVKVFLNIKAQFQDLIQPCDPLPLVKQCSSLLASNTHNISLFTTECREKLQEIKQTHELIQKLSPFMTWDNHSILYAIAEASNNPESKRLLTQFDEGVDSSQLLTSFPIPALSHHMIPYDDSAHTVMRINLDLELYDCTLQNIFDVRSLIQNKCQLTSNCLCLLAVSKTNPVTIFWMIPRNIVKLIVECVLQFRDYFHQNGILQLAVYPGAIISTGKSTLNLEGLSFFNLVSSDNELVWINKHIYTPTYT